MLNFLGNAHSIGDIQINKSIQSCSWIKCQIICLIKNNIILLIDIIDILLLKRKKLPVLDITGFFFRIRTHTASFVSIVLYTILVTRFKYII